MQRPTTDYNWRLMSAARASIVGRPSAEQIINDHIDHAGPFDPWTPESETLFRYHRQFFR